MAARFTKFYKADQQCTWLSKRASVLHHELASMQVVCCTLQAAVSHCFCTMQGTNLACAVLASENTAAESQGKAGHCN